MQPEFFKTFQQTIDREFSGILQECEHYAHCDHRPDLETLCEEVKTAPAGAFVNFFGDIAEDDGDSGCNGDFFASLEGAAYSVALPRLKSTLINHLQEEFSYETRLFGRKAH